MRRSPQCQTLFALLACVLGGSLSLTQATAATPSVGAGLSHSVAVTSDGKVLTWGSDNSGQLGIGRQTFFPTPQKVPGMLLGSGATSSRVAGGTYHNLAVKADGSVWTWGDNLSGQLGDGSITARSTPAAVAGFGQVAAVSAGFAHSLALKTDGTLWTWGSNQSGALGVDLDPSELAAALSPRAVQGLDGYRATAIAAGLFHNLAVVNGFVIAWGDNTGGQLGDGTTDYAISFLVVDYLPAVSAVATGVYHSLALDVDGNVWSWGSNFDGRLGNGSTTDSYFPVRVVGLPRITAIAAGGQHSAALAADGSVWTWGGNEQLQLGDASVSFRSRPAKVAGLVGIRALRAHYNHNLALDAAGTVWAWGAGTTGQLGDGSSATRAAPGRVTAVAGATGIETGLGHSLSIASDGQLMAWGENLAGQLGVAVDTDRTLPTAVTSLSGIVQVAAGFRHTLAVQADGSVWAWGYNLGGQLGDGSFDSKAKPVRTKTITDAVQASAGATHSLARKRDGTVWTWGSNSSGQSGNGTATIRSDPAQVKNFSNAIQVAAGSSFNLALKNDGTVWGWGDNSYRQIGDGTAVQRTVPTLTRGIPAMTAIAAGALHTLALATDGTVWAWGDQTNGKLGNGVSDSASASPQRVSGLTNVVAIAAGSNTSLALRKDGSVWIWGLRISSDDTYDEIYPAKVPGLGNVASISSGLAHVLTAKTDGTVWAWGLNIEGGLGDGTYALHEDNVAVINEAYTNLLDLDLTKANLPVDPTKLPPFFAASQKTGGRKNTSLAVNLRGLLGVAPLSAETPGATAQSAGIQKAQTRATRSYNVYVAASVPNGKQTLLFQLEGTKGWNALVWPMNEYLRGVQLDTQDNVVRTQIFQDADLSGLGGATVYMGYGLDAEEMARAGRFRVIFTVPKN